MAKHATIYPTLSDDHDPVPEAGAGETGAAAERSQAVETRGPYGAEGHLA